MQSGNKRTRQRADNRLLTLHTAPAAYELSTPYPCHAPCEEQERTSPATGIRAASGPQVRGSARSGLALRTTQAICVCCRAPPLRSVRAASTGSPATAGPLPRCRTSIATVLLWPRPCSGLSASTLRASRSARGRCPAAAGPTPPATLRRALRHAAPGPAHHVVQPAAAWLRRARLRPPAFGGGAPGRQPPSAPWRVAFGSSTAPRFPTAKQKQSQNKQQQPQKTRAGDGPDTPHFSVRSKPKQPSRYEETIATLSERACDRRTTRLFCDQYPVRWLLRGKPAKRQLTHEPRKAGFP